MPFYRLVLHPSSLSDLSDRSGLRLISWVFEANSWLFNEKMREIWKDFEQKYFAKMALIGVIKSMKDFYWDIRPKPEFGTVELRVCDTPFSVERAAIKLAYGRIFAAL
ncbi:glutamate-cysteine ligase family protein [Iodobacter fluviatilis]|uniref:Uncharacterized protein n=1 Tax=Iodobacter fluviatilis TaxID=537 RepID=A0A7G3GDA5_9NEIS|nr:glutamate-cysteine ligase family protein [Iodobacter fluviatilis]QBC45457.1 hypothetical protein C1H71_19275 [Iodobacter fluviatilis]